MDIDFFCPIHKEYYLKDSNSLLCKKCGIPVVKKQGIYDFIMQKSEDQSRWDAAFEQDTKKAGILKKAFDALLWKFLPDLLNGYAVSYICKKYPENARFIELGCGIGTLSRTLLQKKDYRIVFLDFSEAALKGLMYRLNREGKVDKVTIIRDDFYNNELCFSDQYFDVSYNVGVIEHFDDPVKALNNMKRIAKNVICVVPAPSIVWKIGTVIRKLIEKDASQWTEHTRYYSLDELKHIFIEAHLKDTHFKQINVLGLPFCNFAQGES